MAGKLPKHDVDEPSLLGCETGVPTGMHRLDASKERLVVQDLVVKGGKERGG